MKILHKKLLRHLKGAWGQSLAIAAVIACGIATYIGLASAHNNLLVTRDAYYAQYRFADFTIMLEQAPMTAVFKVETLPGVRAVRGRIVKDVNLDIGGAREPRVGRIVSMPDRREEVIDDICLTSGRYFTEGALDEVIVSKSFAEANRLNFGDHIQASIANKKHTLKVVGAALSPEYVYMIRGAQELVPSPERFGVLWVPQSFAESALNMQDACNDIVGLVDDAHRVEEILDRAEKLLKPYGVYAKMTARDNISNQFLSDEIKGLATLAKITPTIFLGIAALALLILLNRMVTNERTEIGLLKAYGYSTWTVSFHYIEFAILLGLAGCLGGFLLGQWLAYAMVKIYVEFYQFPLLRARVYSDILTQSVAIGLGCAMLGAVAAARKAARIQPAQSMRVPAPRYGHRTVFEKIPGLWRCLSFTGKMIVRNLSRYRWRAAVSVLGIMASSGILIVGYFFQDAMDYMITVQFTETQREDLRVGLVTERDQTAVYDLAGFDQVRRAEPMLQYPFEIRARWRKKDVGIVGIPPDAELHYLTDDQNLPVHVEGPGLVLSEKLAEMLEVRPGSVVTLKPLMGRITKERPVRVRSVVRQYLGLSAYMDIRALSRMLDESLAVNTVLLRTEPGAERAISRRLKDVAGVSSVEIKADMERGIRDTLERTMDISNMFLAAFAGVIAFAIIYNTTLISLAERQRELASLRVLGFSVAEVGGIMYKENILLAVAGMVLGVPFGMGLCQWLLTTYDTELFRIPFHIEPKTFVRMIVLTVSFVIIANVVAWRKIRDLDMVEVLKARE